MEQEADQAPSENQKLSETEKQNIQTSDTPELSVIPEVQDNTPCGQPLHEMNTKSCESVTSTATSTVPPQPEVATQSGEAQSVNPDRQSRVYTLPESYRGIGGDICSVYGSLSRSSLHSYWPAKNFQPGAHHTLPFLRDSFTSAGLSSQTEGDRLSERGENPLDIKADHPAASYPTLGGIHQFRPITTMELLREPSRTR